MASMAQLGILLLARDEASAVLKKASGSLADLGGAAKLAMVGTAAAAAATTAAVGTMFAMAEGAAHAAEGVRKLTLETGLSAEEASQLAFAGERLNIDTDGLSKSLGIFSKGLEAAHPAIAKYGIEVIKSSDGHVDMQRTLAMVADRFAQMPAGVEKAALSMALFGRGGKDMIPLLDQGSAGLAALGEEAQKMGLVFSGEGLTSAHQFALAQKDLSERFEGLRNTIGLAVMPILTTLIKIFGEVFDVLTGRAPDAGAALTAALGPGMAKTIMGAIGGIREAIMFLKDHMDIAGPAIAAVVVAMAAMIIIALAPILIPLAAIGAAVAALALIWKNNLFDIQGKVQAVIGFISGVFTIFQTEGLGGLLKAVALFALNVVDEFVNMGKGVVKGLLDGLGGMKDALLKAIGDAFAAIDFWVGPFHITGHGIEIVLPAIGGGGGGVPPPPPAGTPAPSPGGGGYYGPGTPGFAEGGIMPWTGLAYLHAGETVTPAGEGGGVTIVFNAPVYGLLDFEATVRRVVREGVRAGGFRGVLASAR